MATRRGRRFKPRRTARGRRQSNTGVLDVRSQDGLAKFVKLLGNGKSTIVVVYADWCGHCHEFMPHFDKAAQNSNHSVNKAKINETMLNKVNEEMTKQNAAPFDVEGYPSVITVTNNGNIPVEPVKDTEVMTNVMNQTSTQAGPMNKMSTKEMEEPAMSTSIGSTNKRSLPSVKKLNSSTTPDFIVGEDEGVSAVMNANNNRNNNRNNKVNNRVNNSVNNTSMNKPPSVKQLEQQTEELASLRTNGPSLASPPSSSLDQEESSLNSPPMKGGSLYSAMAQTAYTLAAPAALLATAALIMRRKTKKRSRRARR